MVSFSLFLISLCDLVVGIIFENDAMILSAIWIILAAILFKE
jgi:hypothetical protein